MNIRAFSWRSEMHIIYIIAVSRACIVFYFLIVIASLVVVIVKGVTMVGRRLASLEVVSWVL